MKKILSVVFAVFVFVSIFAFSSCGDNSDISEEASEQNAELTSEASSETTVEFVSDVESASPGEEITVTFKLANCPYFACISSNIEYDSAVVAYEKHSEYESDSYFDLFNDTGDSLIYFGYVATTENIKDADLLTVTYQISEDAVPGTTTEITLNIEELGVGTDASGDTVNELCDNFAPITLEIKIK